MAGELRIVNLKARVVDLVDPEAPKHVRSRLEVSPQIYDAPNVDVALSGKTQPDGSVRFIVRDGLEGDLLLARISSRPTRAWRKTTGRYIVNVPAPRRPRL